MCINRIEFDRSRRRSLCTSGVATYRVLHRRNFRSIFYQLSIKSFFLSPNKKPRYDEQQTESNVVTSSLSPLSSSPSSESQNLLYSSSLCSGDATTCRLVSDTSSSSPTTSVSMNESFETKSASNEISISCIISHVEPKFKTYSFNPHKRSFQSSWYIDRERLKCSVENDASYSRG